MAQPFVKAGPRNEGSSLVKNFKSLRLRPDFFCQKASPWVIQALPQLDSFHFVKWSFSNLLLISWRISLYIGCLFSVVSTMRDTLPSFSVVPQIYVLQGALRVSVTKSFCHFFLSSQAAVLTLPFVKEVSLALLLPPFVKEASFLLPFVIEAGFLVGIFFLLFFKASCSFKPSLVSRGLSAKTKAPGLLLRKEGFGKAFGLLLPLLAKGCESPPQTKVVLPFEIQVCQSNMAFLCCSGWHHWFLFSSSFLSKELLLQAVPKLQKLLQLSCWFFEVPPAISGVQTHSIWQHTAWDLHQPAFSHDTKSQWCVQPSNLSKHCLKICCHSVEVPPSTQQR